MCASLESGSSHPIASAIIKEHERLFGTSPTPATDFENLSGHGLIGVVDGKNALLGNATLMQKNDVEISLASSSAAALSQSGKTPLYLAIDGKLAGIVAVADELKDDSVQAISALHQQGLKVVMLTGDNGASARSIATACNVDAVISDVLPKDKDSVVSALKKYGKVVMVGDGINDAPALKRAEVGIAMGGVGSDIAVDAADIALVDDEVKELPHLIALSKRMMTTIKLNMTFSMTLNFIAIVLAITGILNPIVGALVHNAGSVLVITNSAFLLKWRKK